ncbi:unnamed protein product [Protopolystoma xenopodis]|uniref:Uncharacterized protein n=1 Tax=Protopolystoma xenopodis TaxID=117903 RepID=A0A448WZN8_9PLAT|nr:unnamed protein product [Protopolystoma xenopodis]
MSVFLLIQEALAGVKKPLPPESVIMAPGPDLASATISPLATSTVLQPPISAAQPLSKPMPLSTSATFGGVTSTLATSEQPITTTDKLQPLPIMTTTPPTIHVTPTPPVERPPRVISKGAERLAVHVDRMLSDMDVLIDQLTREKSGLLKEIEVR